MSESSSARRMSGSPDVSDHSGHDQSGQGSGEPGRARRAQAGESQPGPPTHDDPVGLAQRIEGHLGSAGPGLELVSSTYSAWHWADVDVALHGLDENQTLHGVGPAICNLAELFTNGPDDDTNGTDDRAVPHEHRADPVQRSTFPVGPDEVRFVATNAVRLVRLEGTPVVVFAHDTPGESNLRVEVLAADLAAARSALARIEAAVWEHSSLRGRVVGFRTTAAAPSAPPNSPSFTRPSPAIAFHERPGLIADEVVLPAGHLARVESVVLGMSRNAVGMRAAGQHLPRGVLLHGPPGSGKTHTVRYLLAQSPETTAFLLPSTLLSSMRADDMHTNAMRQGGPVDFIRQVLSTALRLTPAVVVLEDIDLIDGGLIDGGHAAEDAAWSGLVQVFDALDELHDDEDADVAVIVTTSRPEAIAPALARRPGVIDLALEVPLPGASQREQLFARSARALPVTSAGVRTAAEVAVATPGSFPRRAVRRAVLDALSTGAEVDDVRLVSAVRALMAEREDLRTSSGQGTAEDRRSSAARAVDSGPGAAGLVGTAADTASPTSAWSNATGPELHASSEHSDEPWVDGSVAEVRGAGDVLAVLRARESRRDSFGAEGAFGGGRHGDGPGGEGGLEGDRGLGGGTGVDGGGLGGDREFEDDDLGESDGLDGGDGLDHGGHDAEVIDDLDDGLSGEDLLDLDLDDED